MRLEVRQRSTLDCQWRGGGIGALGPQQGASATQAAAPAPLLCCTCLGSPFQIIIVKVYTSFD